MKLRVIGLGSPHGDDQIGWEVIRLLQQQTLPTSVELLQLDRPGPALISYLHDCDHAILIDACDAGWPVGEFRALDTKQLLECAELQGGSSHQLGVADSLQLAQITGTQLPELSIYTIQIAQCQPLAAISPQLQQPLMKITQEIVQSLQKDAQ